MPTREEYSARLLPRLAEGFRPHLVGAARGRVLSVAGLAATLGGILEELERQHLGASAHVQAVMGGQPTQPWEGHGNLAFLLYYLHKPPPALRAEINALPELRIVWDAMAAVAAPSPFTPESFTALGASLPAQAMVKCTEWGDIYGTGKYEQLDAGWAWTVKNDLMNHLPRKMGKGCGVANFVKRDWKKPLALQPGSDGQVRIAIIGDWGSCKYSLHGLANKDGPACAVMNTLGKLKPAPDYLVHMGDTYYSGTDANRSPAREERLCDADAE